MIIRNITGGAWPHASLPSAALTLCLLTGIAFAQPGTPQQSFPTAEQAVAALVAAMEVGTPQALIPILGPNADKLVSSGDPYADKAASRRFVTAYAENHRLKSDGPDRMLLDVGGNDWQLPIPIMRTKEGWRFDTVAGAQELIDRRIGRNEVQAIRTLLGVVDAEKSYFAITETSGHAEYAERFVATPGKRDGLYWPAAPDAEESPLGPLVATAEAEGYPGELVGGKPNPYQGYYFRILKVQGPDASGGTKDYVVHGRMTGGFAVVAWPASYGGSGIMTFIVDQEGTVFQKDLGPETVAIASAMRSFNPDLTWTRVDVGEH